MVLISELKDLQDCGTITASLEMMTARACHSHSDNNFCVVGCQTTLWYSTTRIAQHLCTLPNALSQLQM